MNYSQLINLYIRKDRPRASEELEFYSNAPDLKSAIQRAAFCVTKNGQRHSHQTRIPQNILHIAEHQLQSIKNELRNAKNFDDLHNVIRKKIKGNGIGELTVYDITQRIGVYLKKYPTLVYLHAGTKVGARKLLGFKRLGATINPKILPKEFSVLTPAEIEDLLCIYKNGIGRNCFNIDTAHSC